MVSVNGYPRDPQGHGLWLLGSIALMIVAAVVAYIVHELHAAKTK